MRQAASNHETAQRPALAATADDERLEHRGVAPPLARHETARTKGSQDGKGPQGSWINGSWKGDWIRRDASKGGKDKKGGKGDGKKGKDGKGGGKKGDGKNGKSIDPKLLACNQMVQNGECSP